MIYLLFFLFCNVHTHRIDIQYNHIVWGGVLVDCNCPGCDVECVILCSLFFLFNTQNRERENIPSWGNHDDAQGEAEQIHMTTGLDEGVCVCVYLGTVSIFWTPSVQF